MTAFVSDNSTLNSSPNTHIQGSDVDPFYDTYQQPDTTEIDMEYDVEEEMVPSTYKS